MSITRRRPAGASSRPLWIFGIGIVVVAVAAWLVAGSGGDLAPTIPLTTQLVTVTRGTLADTVSAQGSVASASTANLSFSAAGTITAVNVKAGDSVTTGQVLATMDSAQLRATVASAQATVTTAQAKLSDDQAAGGSAAQLAADQTSLDSANDALNVAQQALAGASLIASFNGSVTQVNITAGQQLGSGGTSATSATGSQSGSGRSASGLASAGGSNAAGSTSSSSAQVQVVTPTSFTVTLPVASSDVANVAVGQSVTLTVTTAANSSGFGGLGGGGFGNRPGGTGAAASSSSSSRTATGATTTGKVTSVAKVATSTSGVAQYPVIVTFTAPTGFYSGASVIGAIAINARDNVLEVPAAAVTTSNGTSTVVVATKGSLSGPTQTRTVKTGASANGFVEITSGLKEGDQIVITTQTLATGTTPTTTGGSSTGGAGSTGRNGTGTGRTVTGG